MLEKTDTAVQEVIWNALLVLSATAGRANWSLDALWFLLQVLMQRWQKEMIGETMVQFLLIGMNALVVSVDPGCQADAQLVIALF